MHIVKLKVNNSIKDKLLECLSREVSCTYRNDFGDNTIIVGEEFRFRISSNQLYFILFKTTGLELFIDIVCGGGGEGMFNITWGSEKVFVKRVRNVIVEFCENNNEVVEEL